MYTGRLIFHEHLFVFFPYDKHCKFINEQCNSNSCCFPSKTEVVCNEQPSYNVQIPLDEGQLWETRRDNRSLGFCQAILGMRVMRDHTANSIGFELEINGI